MNLVSLQEAEAHLRLDNDAETSWLSVFIPVVSGAVATWLKDSWRLYVPSGFEDSQGNPIPAEDSEGTKFVDPVVKGAVLIELAQQFRFRDGSGAAAVPSHAGHGYVLGAGATSMLSGMRRSTAR